MPWRTRALLPHALVVAVALGGLAWWAGAAGQVSIDEGVAVLQARAVADGGWGLDHPLAEVDPRGGGFPLRHAVATDDGEVPFAKHPAYPALLSVADRLGGIRAMVGLSLLGTLAGAIGAALLSARLDRRLPVPTLYVVGLGSPLLFDGMLVIAHALGAALVAWGAVAVVRAREVADGADPAPLRGRVGPAALAGLAAAGTVLLRGEGVLLVAAATLVLLVTAARGRDRAGLLLAGTVAIGGATGLVVDRLWSRAILGGGLELAAPSTTATSWASDRASALGINLFRVDDGGTRGSVLLVVALVLLVGAAVARRPSSGLARWSAPLAGAGAALAAIWAVGAPFGPVPGLLVAFPVLLVGLVAGPWWRAPLARGLVAVGGLFAVAVVLTEYRIAGAFEWGARYLALALPLVVPVALSGLLRDADAAPPERAVGTTRTSRWALVGALVLVTVVLSGKAVSTIRSASRGAQELGAAITAVAPPTALGPDDRDRRPVVISAEYPVPQATWRAYDGARWLQVRSEGLGPPLARLLRSGADRLTLVTLDLDRDRAHLAGARIVARHQVGAWTIAELAAP